MNLTSNAPEAGGYKRLASGIYVPSHVSPPGDGLDLAAAEAYRRYLQGRGRSAATVEKYMLHIQRFLSWLGDRYLSVSRVREWLEEMKRTWSINTVNSAISALNGLFRWLGRTDCTVSFFPRQEPPYREDDRNLELKDLHRLLTVANRRMGAILRTFYATGIRVSELKFFTVEAVKTGQVIVDNKGKVRTVFLDPDTRRMLLGYCKEAGIWGGPIFRNRRGQALSRSYLWRAMKELARKAGVALRKVFPHNLRHLFALERYRADHDIESLRLDMGHSLISTTQRYLKETVSQHFRRIQRRNLWQLE